MGVLDDIAGSMFLAVQNLEQEERIVLEDTVADGNTLIEGLSYLIEIESPDLKDLLKDVIDEVFVDLHISVTLATARQFKAACVLLRTCVETGLYVVYFADHPLEAKMWANNFKDLSFSDLLIQVVNHEYLSIASRRKVDINDVKKTFNTLQTGYRELSERVHGKYAFLQLTASEAEPTSKIFATLASNSIRALIKLIRLRCYDIAAMETKIPAIWRIS
jgi:hypothetical protein